MLVYSTASYQQALNDRDLRAVFCDRYIPRMVPDADPARVWARASWYGMDAALLAQLCAHQPDTVRATLAA